MLELELKSDKGGFGLDVALQVPVGVTAILGPSGAGKSSLLRLIAGLDHADEGTLKLDDTIWFDSASKKNLDTRHRHIGMMFQHPRLLDHLDVLSNVELGRRDEQSIENVLTTTGVDKLMSRPVSSLSGGEKQRVMLARALAGKPKLLLLDEPFSGLDQTAKRALLERLAKVLPQVGVPVLLVTHAFDEAARLADRFVHISAGKIVSAGSAAEVLGGIAPKVDLDTPQSAPALASDAHEAATNSLLSGVVESLETGGLARVRVGGQKVDAPAGSFSVGDRIFLRLWARDVILSTLPARNLSARNCLVGKIQSLQSLANGQVEVLVDVEGDNVSALVMATTSSEMKLERGKPIFVVFKSTALDLSAVVEDVAVIKPSSSNAGMDESGSNSAKSEE